MIVITVNLLPTMGVNQIFKLFHENNVFDSFYIINFTRLNKILFYLYFLIVIMVSNHRNLMSFHQHNCYTHQIGHCFIICNMYANVKRHTILHLTILIENSVLYLLTNILSRVFFFFCYLCEKCPTFMIYGHPI